MDIISRTRAITAKRGVLWTLIVRDLRVRYSRSVLGYVWTVLDPLLMSLIYFVVFVYIFKRGDVGHKPYFLFLVIGLLSWPCRCCSPSRPSTSSRTTPTSTGCW
jgi:ABC-2 type transport system permease protein